MGARTEVLGCETGGMSASASAQVRFTKHEGAGNDFLVLLDVEDEIKIDEALARGLCDRRRGVGADGVIRVTGGHDGADLSMELRNADGGTAATSGNGLRCLAQAAVEAGLVEPPRFTVSTEAGIKTIEYFSGPHPGVASASVGMGSVALGEELAEVMNGNRARMVDTGNLHLVVLLESTDSVESLDVSSVGPRLSKDRGGGINVEFIALGSQPDELVLRVWENGVGETLACGTGSCAAAAAAGSWGIVGGSVKVHNPGGTLDVTVDDSGAVALAGPVRKVADVWVDLSLLT